jgi:hypothetical protein
LGTFFSYIGGPDPSRIIDAEPVFISLGPQATSTRITVENTTMYGQRVEDMWNTAHPVNGSAITMDVEIAGVCYRVFTGIVSRVSNWTRSQVTFDCMSSAALYDRLVGTTLNKTDFPNLPEENVGKILPWVWGTVNDYMPLLVDEDQITELTAAALSTDTIIYVKDATDFPATGDIRINDEVITYTVKTATQFGDASNPCSRGQNDAYGDATVASSHVVGNQVMEVGELKFAVAKHVVAEANITNVRYLGRDDIKIPAAAADYTIDDTGPTYIAFDQAPVFEEPATTHRLKLIDYEDDDGTSTCANPTYACGGHANWTELNYATIENGEFLEIERTADVTEPGGDLIRAWLVVEYYKNFTGNGGEVYFNGAKLGDLPDASDTPSDIMEDQSSWLMSAGFEQAHTHTIDDGYHNHSTEGAGTANFIPAMDTGDAGHTAWNSHPQTVDGDWDTYDTVDPVVAQKIIYWPFLRGTEGLNFFKKIKKMNCTVKLGRDAGGGSGVFSFGIRWNASWGGGSNLSYDWIDAMATNDLPLTPADGAIYSSGWFDVETKAGGAVWAFDIHNAWFQLNETTGSTAAYDVYMMSIDMQIENATSLLPGSLQGKAPYLAYEPCSISTSPGYPDSYDLDWATWESAVPLETTFQWSSTASPNSKILAITPSVVADHDKVDNGPSDKEYKMVIRDQSIPTTYTIHFAGFGYLSGGLGSTVGNGISDMSAYDLKGTDLLDPFTLIKVQNTAGATTKDIIEVGAWIWYDQSYSNMTSFNDVGDADSQDTLHSSLAWFDITAMDGWQYPVNKDIKVLVNGSAGDEVYVLRAMVCGEYAPMEKRLADKIVCDVVGRTGTASSVITDMLTQSDLLGIPAANVSVATTTNALAGAIQDQENGFALLEGILQEGLCHGYWSWSGVFTVKSRPARSSLSAADFTLIDEDVFSLSRGVRDLSTLVNDLEAKYNFDYIKNALADSVTSENATSQTKYSKTANKGVDLNFIRTEAAAQTVGDTILSYLEECFEDVNPAVGIVGLNLEPGDLVNVKAEGISASKVEIKECRILGVFSGELKVELKGVHYGI